MLPPALIAYTEREEGGSLGGFPVGGCAGVAALFTSFSLSIPGSFYPRGVRGGGFGLALPRHTLLVHACVWAYHSLFLCPRACCLCV